jgi:hypothetical protein
MSNEFKVKNGLIVIGELTTSGTITINGALAATQSWVTSQAYLTSSSLTSYATQSYVTSAIASLVDSAPGALDTLRELATALGNDASFSTTVTNSIAAKLPLAGGTLTGALSGTSATFSNNVSVLGLTVNSVSTFSSLATFNGNISLGGNSTYYSNGTVTLGGALTGTSATFSGDLRIAGVGTKLYFDTLSVPNSIYQYVENNYDLHFINTRGDGAKFVLGNNIISFGTVSAVRFSISQVTGAATLSSSLTVERIQINSTTYEPLAINSSYGQVGLKFGLNGSYFAAIGSANNVTGAYAGSETDLGIGTYGSATANITFATGTGLGRRMTITAAGNVGIGTTSPVVKLQVDGTITSTGTLTAYTSVPSINIGHNGDSAFIASTSGGGANTPISFSVGNNAEKMRITSGGNVLIGTTTDVGAKLYVDGGIRASGALLSGGLLEFTGAWSASPYNGSAWVRPPAGVGIFLVNNAITKWAGFKPNDDFVVNSDNLLVQASTGNVGIGTSSPSYKLDVRTDSLGSNAIAVKLTDGYQRVKINNYDLLGYSEDLWMLGQSGRSALLLSDDWNWDRQVALNYIPGSSGAVGGILSIGQLTDAKNSATYTHGITRFFTNGLERLRINSAGNVGIGTTSPTAPLDTNGVRIGRNWAIADRANIRLDSNGTAIPADILFGHTSAANQISWDGVYWSLSSRGSSLSNAFTIWRGAGNPGGAGEEIIFTILPNGNVGIGTTDPTSQMSGTFGIGIYNALYPAVGFKNSTTAWLWYGQDSTFRMWNATFGDILTANTSGNIGIGTGSPSTKLDVNGVITATGGNSTNWNTAYSWGNHASAGYLTSYSETDTLASVTNRGESTTGRINVRGPGNQGGGNIMMGNIGEGTSKWSYLTSTHYNASSQPQGFALIGGLATSGGNAVVIGGNIYETNPATEIQFWTHGTNTHNLGGTQRGVINSSGNWGIGTTNPGDYKLYVNGGQFGTLLRGGDLGTGSDVVRMIKSDGSAAMLVRGDGKVGIGTLSPSEEFHVSGRAIFDGGSGNSSTDAVVYITKSNNNDWGLYVNAAALDYGMYARVSSSANYALAIHNGTTWTTRITGDGRIYLTEKDTIASYDTWLRLNESGHYGSGVFTPGVMRADGGFNVSGSTVWHAGNDGSGSGLDADLLDGQNSTEFLRLLSGGAEASLDSYTDNGIRSVNFTGHSQHLLSWNAGGSTGTVQQLFHYGTPNNGWRIRNKTDNTSWSDWGYVVMASSNQGLISGTIATQSWVGSQSYATTSYVTTQINNLINGAPGALDTLNELATALGNDASFSTTVTNSIAGKVSKAGDTMTSSGQQVLNIFHGAATGDFNDALFVKNTVSAQQVQIGMATTGSDGDHHRVSLRAYKGAQALEGVFGIALRQPGSAAHTQRLTLDYLGNLTIGGFLTESSSFKLKENVETSEGNLEKVVNLRPVTYNKIGSQTTELGLIAEEVAEVYPEFVQYDESGEPVGVNYSRLTAALIGAVKELTNQVQELNKKING